MNTQRDRSFVLTTLCAAVLTGSLGFTLTAGAATKCYQWNAFPGERLVLDIEDHSRLSTRQEVFSVAGKHVGVCGASTIAAVTGTIVRARAPLPVTGAHMGLRTHSVRATTAPNDAHIVYCKEVTFDCTSAEADETPGSWTCFARNEWDIVWGHGHPLSTVLTPVSPQDALCKIFQDGLDFSPPYAPPGPFSGGQ